MTIPASVNNILFAMTAVAMLASFVRSRRSFLFFCGFIIPILVPGMKLGVNLLWPTLIGPAALFLSFGRRRNVVSIEGSGVGIIIGYATIVSLAWFLAETYYFQRSHILRSMGLGAAQAEYKILVQLVSFTFQLLAFYVVPRTARSSDEAQAGMRGFMQGCAVSALTGILLWLTTGQGMFGTEGRGVFELETFSITRIGGLSGEPKMLGAFLIVGASLALATVRHELLHFGRKWLVFLLGTLFLTFSTSAWLGIGVLLAAYIWGTHRQRGIKTSTMALAGIVIVLLIGRQVPVVNSLFQTRVAQRVWDKDSQQADTKEDFVFDVLRENPQHGILGYGLGGTDYESAKLLFRENKYAAQRQYARTPTASATGVRLLGDLGVVGMLLIFFVVLKWRRRLELAHQPELGLFVFIGAFALIPATIFGVTAYFFLAGAALSYAHLRLKEAHPQTAPPTISPIGSGHVAKVTLS